MAALAMGAATLPACFVPSLSAAPCSGVSPDTVAAIEDRVTVDGRLRHPFAYTSEESGVTFVSAELHMATDEPEDAGDILTWAATDGSLRSFAAVDEQARKKSAWPTAEEMDAKTHGVIISRGCTHTLRGQVICETQTGEQIAGVEAECPDEEED